MKLHLNRDVFTDNYTLGKLYVDGVFECFTCEDRTRDPFIKVPKETSIPYGEYTVVIDLSKRFNRPMPHILAVPEFEGIRIHSGNTSKDTEGCILVGTTRDYENGVVINSKTAFNLLYGKLEAALALNEEISILIDK